MKKLYITGWHIAIEIVSYALIAASFIVAVVELFTLPDRIPTHYDFVGTADAYGSPASLFVMPVTMFICNLVLSLIAHSRKVMVYRDIVSMYMWIELETALFNLAVVVMCYTQRMGGIMAITIIFVIAALITIICCSILAARHNKG